MLVGSKLYYCCLLAVSMYVFETTCIKLFLICEILPDQSSKQESWNIWYNNKHHSLLYFYYIALQDAGWRHSRTMPFIWNCTVGNIFRVYLVTILRGLWLEATGGPSIQVFVCPPMVLWEWIFKHLSTKSFCLWSFQLYVLTYIGNHN